MLFFFFAKVHCCWAALLSLPYCVAWLIEHLPLLYQVSTAPVGAEACGLDIEAAYQTTLVFQEHKRAMVVTHCGSFWIEHCVTFGVSSAHALQGEITNGTIAIWKKKDVGPFAKWVDDIIMFRFPSSKGTCTSTFSKHHFSYDHTSALACVASLRVPWHKSKCHDFCPVFQFLGFTWSLAESYVTINEEKRIKNKGKVDSFLAMFLNNQTTLKDVQKIFGSLSHLTFVYIDMCSFLPPLTVFAASFAPNPHASRYPPPSVLSALRSWSQVLSRPPVHRSLIPKGAPRDVGLWVDASISWGIGVIIGGQWISWKLSSNWKLPGHDIGWLGTLAVELASLTLVHLGFSNVHLLLHSDNQGVIGSHDKGRSQNYECNLSIRRTGIVCTAFNISLSLMYVESEVNLADPISHGILSSPSTLIPHDDITLPEEICSCFTLYPF